MKIITKLIILLFSVSVMQAQDTNLKLAFSGYGELDQIAYFKNEQDKINNRFQSLLSFDLNAALKKKSAFKANLKIRNDLADKSRNRIFLNEFYVDFFTKNVDLRIGKQIINWGQADSYNPLDNFNPRDLSDILDTENEVLPIYGTRLKYYIKDLTFDLVFAPVFTPSILPHPESRWTSDLPTFIPNPTSPDFMLKANYTFAEFTPNYTIGKDLQLGLKTSYSFPGWDLGMSYYYGFNDVPKYIPTYGFTNPGEVNIQITPDYYKWHVLGIDFATSIGQFGIRSETGLFVSEKTDFFERDPVFVQAVLGIDRTFVNVFNENNLMVILEWIQEFVIDGDSFVSNDFNHYFQRALFLRLQQDIGNFTQFSLQAVYDFKSQDFYLQPHLSYEISNGFNVTLASDIIISKSREGFFHQYRNNDRVQLKLKYNY